jgi:hypothetical protein
MQLYVHPTPLPKFYYINRPIDRDSHHRIIGLQAEGFMSGLAFGWSLNNDLFWFIERALFYFCKVSLNNHECGIVTCFQ